MRFLLYKDYTKKHLKKIILSAIFSILVAGSTSAIAWLLDPAIEKIFINKDQTLIILIPFAIILAFTTKGISLYFAKLIMINVGEEVKKIIDDMEIKCPISGTCNWTEVRQFNLMFSTKLGASEESSMDLYLRPETAQGIFLNYLNVQKTSRMKIPFGIAQTGKAFRNEIVARQFIFLSLIHISEPTRPY